MCPRLTPCYHPWGSARRRSFLRSSAPGAKVRVYNAYLQGQFRHSDPTYRQGDLNQALGEAWAGLEWRTSSGWAIQYLARWESPELRLGVISRAGVRQVPLAAGLSGAQKAAGNDKSTAAHTNIRGLRYGTFDDLRRREAAWTALQEHSPRPADKEYSRLPARPPRWLW